jgi:hypothetical protein
VSVGGKATPAYRLATMESADGIRWPHEATTVFPVEPGVTLGYGRSHIWQEDGGWRGLVPVRAWDGRYRALRYTESLDGIAWAPLTSSGMAFHASDTVDGQAEVSFPSLIMQEERTLMFYDGDDFGRAGLRCAVWSPS